MERISTHNLEAYPYQREIITYILVPMFLLLTLTGIPVAFFGTMGYFESEHNIEERVAFPYNLRYSSYYKLPFIDQKFRDIDYGGPAITGSLMLVFFSTSSQYIFYFSIFPLILSVIATIRNLYLPMFTEIALWSFDMIHSKIY